MPVSEFDIGDQVQIRVTFTSNSTPTDPTEVEFRLLPPTAVNELLESYNGGAGNVQRESTGVYYYNFTVAESGVHRYRWKATGAVVAASPDVEFLVRTTIFSNP